MHLLKLALVMGHQEGSMVDWAAAILGDFARDLLPWIVS